MVTLQSDPESHVWRSTNGMTCDGVGAVFRSVLFQSTYIRLVMFPQSSPARSPLHNNVHLSIPSSTYSASKRTIRVLHRAKSVPPIASQHQQYQPTLATPSHTLDCLLKPTRSFTTSTLTSSPHSRGSRYKGFWDLILEQARSQAHRHCYPTNPSN